MAKTDKFSFLNYEYLTKDIKKLPNARLSDLEKKYTFSYLGGHYGIKNTSPDFD
jgi:glycosylphosphatidylinositol transamidase (GPIT) subunit GPI8